MVYVRFCRQNLLPIPPVSPVPAPSSDLVAVLENFPTLDATKPFDPAAIRTHLDVIIIPFARHMTDELATLSKENIGLVGKEGYAEIEAKIGAKLRGYGPEWFLCSAFGQSTCEVRGAGLQLTRLQLPCRRLCSDRCFRSLSSCEKSSCLSVVDDYFRCYAC